jgi:hypothetical protein
LPAGQRPDRQFEGVLGDLGSVSTFCYHYL